MAKQFRHQAYEATPPTSPYYLVRPESFPHVECAEFRERMQQVGQSLRASDVGAIYLVHGTFAGGDALGIFGELERFLPSASDSLRQIVKSMFDALAGEAGNYTPQYAQLFEQAINSPGETHLPVRLFRWSSENHHIGRADAAVKLILEAAALGMAGKRLLFWGHSHAGNVFALMTNLLANDRELLERFFAASRHFYRWPVLGRIDIPLWEQARETLCSSGNPLAQTPLDMVTFGTPIRYGWNTDGCGNLLHFTYHRPASGVPEYQAPFPPRLEDMLSAAHGDYIQQLGIAGTNIMPSLVTWRAWLADRNLRGLLEPAISIRGLLARFQAGIRVAETGTTLLVDYGPAQGNITQHVAGHALYTRKEWLLFQAEEVVRRFYLERASVAAPHEFTIPSRRTERTTITEARH